MGRARERFAHAADATSAPARAATAILRPALFSCSISFSAFRRESGLAL